METALPGMYNLAVFIAGTRPTCTLIHSDVWKCGVFLPQLLELSVDDAVNPEWKNPERKRQRSTSSVVDHLLVAT